MPRALKILYLFLLLCPLSIAAQELNCRVEVNTSQISGTNKQVFETLKEAITDYMNSTIFTPAQFSPNEKIDCTIFLTVKEYGDDNIIKGDLQVQSTRPVYNSAYITTLLNFKDAKIDFSYAEGDQLIFSQNTMESQLTALLNYYAYLILALDFDSFSSRGGDQYWERLKQIVQMGQSSGEIGWKAFEDNKNRAALLAVFTDPQTAGMRDMVYQYHRQGLDQMSLSPDKGRQAITKSLAELTKVYNASSMSVGLTLFRDAKMDELVNIYSKAPQTERTDAYNVLQPLYPADNQRLDKIRKGQETK